MVAGGLGNLCIGVLVLGMFVSPMGCSEKPEEKEGTAKPAEVVVETAQLLDRTGDELKEMLGEPDNFKIETSNNPGYLTWKDVQGIKIFVVLNKGISLYVTYQFSEDEDFHEEEALRMVGLERPEVPPREIAPAKRWEPYGKYDRLTINPDTRLVSVGSKRPMKKNK